MASIDDHIRLIRRAFADAAREGFVIDFDWKGWGSVESMKLKIVHESQSWKYAKDIYPLESK